MTAYNIKRFACAVSLSLCVMTGTVGKVFAGGDDSPEFVCQFSDSLHWIALCPGNQNYLARVVFAYERVTKDAPLSLIDSTDCKPVKLDEFNGEDFSAPIESSAVVSGLTYWTAHHQTSLYVRRYKIPMEQDGSRAIHGAGPAVIYYPWSTGGGVLFSNIPNKLWTRLDTDVSTATIPTDLWKTLETARPNKDVFNRMPESEIQKFVGSDIPWKQTAYRISGSSGTIIIDAFRDRAPYLQDRAQILWTGLKGQKSKIYEGEFRGEYSADKKYRILVFGGCPTAIVLSQEGTPIQEITACTGGEAY